MPEFYPIIYIRGYAATESSIEEAQALPYYGFNLGSTKKQPGPDGRYIFDIFESQVVRFAKDHGYVDALNDGVDKARQRDPNFDKYRSLWILRYYDQGRQTIGEYAQQLHEMITEEVFPLLQDPQRGQKVILICHSMGGLVARQYIQNFLPSNQKSAGDFIIKLVTIGTPHGGIEMEQRPVELLRNIGSFFGVNNLQNFDPDVIKRNFNIPDDGDARDLYGAFDPDKCLCVVGTNYQAYPNFASSWAVGDASDGLVRIDNAAIIGAHQAHIHRSHSGPQGLVNSMAAYENIQRFLFGDVKVDIALTDMSVKTRPNPNSTYRYTVDNSVSIRNLGIYVHQRKEDHDNPMPVDLVPGQVNPTVVPLYTGFLNSSYRRLGSTAAQFRFELMVLEHEHENIRWAPDREYPAKKVINDDLLINITWDGTPTPPVEYKWDSQNTLTSVSPNAEGEYRIPTAQGNWNFSGTLVFKPQLWR